MRLSKRLPPATQSRVMTAAAVLSVASVLSTAAAVCATAAARPVASAAGRCLPKQTTVSGHRAFINCGPATATLTLGHKTHSFSDGTCDGHGSVLIVDLGETVIGGKGENDGKPDFTLTITGKGGTVEADDGGQDLMKAGEALVTVSHGAATKGTFYGKLITNAEPFTGTWNCHGPIIKSDG